MATTNPRRPRPSGPRNIVSSRLYVRASATIPVAAAASSPVVGTTPPRIPTAITRSAISCAHAERVGPATGQPHDEESVVAEVVGDHLDVGGRVAHVAIQVVARRADARPLDAHEAEPEPIGGGTRDRRHLPAGAGRPMEPQHQYSVLVAELCVAERATVRQRDGSLDARRWVRRNAERADHGSAIRGRRRSSGAGPARTGRARRDRGRARTVC